MIKRFAIRHKATGKFLSVTKSGRKFVDIQDAKLYLQSGHAKNALYHIKEVNDWMFKNNRRSSYNLHAKDFPFEVMEFNVLLIDAKKGYI